MSAVKAPRDSPGTRNLPASVRARLLDRAHALGEDYQRVLNRFAMERFLYRVGTSDLRDRLILKGANLFLAWQGSMHRATKDLDLLGFGPPEVDAVCELVKQVCRQPGADGLVFLRDSVRGERIREDAHLLDAPAGCSPRGAVHEHMGAWRPLDADTRDDGVSIG